MIGRQLASVDNVSIINSYTDGVPRMGSSIDSGALGGSSKARFIFRSPEYYRGARAGGPLEYW